MHTTVEELLRAVFSNQSMSKLCKRASKTESTAERELHDAQSRETVKYGNKSCGTLNKRRTAGERQQQFT